MKTKRNKKHPNSKGNTDALTFVQPWETCRTKQDAYYKGETNGDNKGYYKGKIDGAAEMKTQQQDNYEKLKLNAIGQVLQQAAYFQECITKLVMSINKDL